MQTINRFIIFTKRILTKKIYIAMLLIILAMTVTYRLLPEQSKNAEIKVAICNMDDSYYHEELMGNLEARNSLYSFYCVDDSKVLIDHVKSGVAECGYVVPENFYFDYIHGTAYDNPITQYVIPSSALSSVISETLFSSILTVCSKDVLSYAADIHEYDGEMSNRLDYYVNSDEIFTVRDTTSGEFNYKTTTYHIDLPIAEVVVILLTFSGLLGLLVFLQDKEKGIYKVLSRKDTLQIKCIGIGTSILPILILGTLAVFISFGSILIPFILSTALLVFFVSIGLSFIIRKSTLLEKVLPLLMLICILRVFLKTLI